MYHQISLPHLTTASGVKLINVNFSGILITIFKASSIDKICIYTVTSLCDYFNIFDILNVEIVQNVYWNICAIYIFI